MLDIQEGPTPEKAARDWIDYKQDKVTEWTARVKEIAKGSQE